MSVARESAVVLPAARPRARSARIAWLESHALFIAAIATVIVLSLTQSPTDLAQDGWLALVAGRLIAAHGIPSHDYLTVMAHGAPWIDQQWLSQLTIFELERVGGLALYVVAYVALTAGAFVLAIAGARGSPARIATSSGCCRSDASSIWRRRS